MKHRGKQWRARGAVFQFENARQLQIARCVASQEAGVNEGDGSIAGWWPIGADLRYKVGVSRYFW